MYLCTVLMRNPNFLVLDEPTNDLDIVTLQVLEEYLQNFKGCVIVVSHDRYFMDKVVDHLLVFKGQGDIRDFPGNYSDYRDWKLAKAEHEKEAAKPKEEKTQRVRLNDKRRMTFKERKEFEQLEKEIAALEEEKKQIEEVRASANLLNEAYKRTNSAITNSSASKGVFKSLRADAEENVIATDRLNKKLQEFKTTYSANLTDAAAEELQDLEYNLNNSDIKLQDFIGQFKALISTMANAKAQNDLGLDTNFDELTQQLNELETGYRENAQVLDETLDPMTEYADKINNIRNGVSGAIPVLTTLFNKALNVPATQYLDVISTLAQYATTNLNTNEILKLATKIGSMGLNGVTIEQERFPIDGYYEGTMIDGIYYLTFDATATRTQVMNYIFNDQLPQ